MNDYRLMEGPSIPINPELAATIDLNESIILQQIHYWCCKNAEKGQNYRDGHYWVFYSMPGWAAQFPWWGKATVERAFRRLKKQGLIITGNYNRRGGDRTTWYRVDYDELEKISLSFQYAKMTPPPSKMSTPSHQNDVMDNLNLMGALPNINKNKKEINEEPLKDNPTTAEFLSYDDLGSDLDEFYDWYYRRWAQIFGKNHPPIKDEQKKRNSRNIIEFLYWHPDVEFDELCEMAENFFCSVKSNDWHINHFADPQILKYRYLEIRRFR